MSGTVLSCGVTQTLRESVMLKIGGKPFRCDCECNVFTKVAPNHYHCNACGNGYASPGDEESSDARHTL